MISLRYILSSVRLIIYLGVYSIPISLFGQKYILSSYIKGDWYFLDAENGDCGFDSVYYEIAFFDFNYSYINSCTRSEYTYNYKIKNNRITGYTINDSIVMTGKVEIVDAKTFVMIIDDSRLKFHRIIGKDYKYSDLVHDNQEINKLELRLPSQISNSIWYHGYNYYSGCLRRRELWLRLERGDVEKNSVIKWANKMMSDCYELYEAGLYLDFIIMIETNY